MQQKNYSHSFQRQMFSCQTGLRVRTGLRGGVCMDVNEQVQAALQTLTDALGGAAAAPVAPIATDTATASS